MLSQMLRIFYTLHWLFQFVTNSYKYISINLYSCRANYFLTATTVFSQTGRQMSGV